MEYVSFEKKKKGLNCFNLKYKLKIILKLIDFFEFKRTFSNKY